MKHILSKFESFKMTEIADGSNETTVKNPGIGIRHLQSLLLALCVVCGYLQRVNLSVTIVAMTKKQNSTEQKQVDDFSVYDWNNDVAGYLHAAFFIGYFIMNSPAAYLGLHHNLKTLLFITFLVNGILTCFTPFLINFTYYGTNETLLKVKELAGNGNWRALVVLRAVQGMFQAFMFPTIHAISARWAPPNERSRLVGFILSGVPFGTTITLVGSGILASRPHLGWPFIFYVSGILGLIWTFFWAWFGSSSPSTHPTISSNEYNYISRNLPPENITLEKKVPWFNILTSVHVWAIIVAHTTYNWSYWLLLSEMPTFLNAVAGFNIKADGLLSSTPYIIMWILQFPVMWVADRLNERGVTSLTVSRKLWSTIGLWGAAVCLMVLGHFDDNILAAVTLYIVSVAIGSCCNVGFNVNHLDLTSNYAGILMGLSNGLAATGGIGAPLMVSTLVHDITSVSQWRVIFYIAGGILLFGNLFFLAFASGKTQPWNNKFKSTA